MKQLDNLADMRSRAANAIESLGRSSWEQVDILISEHNRFVEAQGRLEETMAGDATYELSISAATSINPVTEALSELTSQFRPTHDEAMWEAEQQTHILTGIHDVTENSRGAEAEELLSMGRESLRAGMVDEALDLLEKSIEKNPVDYRAYVAMGYAYIEKDEPESALDRFEYALRNARTEGYQTRALLLIARMKYITGDFAEAVQITRTIVNAHPDDTDAHYRLAGYYASNSEASEAISCLQYLIEGGETITDNTIKADRNYFVKAQIGMEFSNRRYDINSFLQKLLQKERELSKEAIQNAQVAIEKAQEWHIDLNFAESELAKAELQFETQSYFGYQDAQPPARETATEANDAKLKQQKRMRAEARRAMKAAQNELKDVKDALQKLTEPQKQLETSFDPNERFQTGVNKFAESRRHFDTDTYSGYIQAYKNAKVAQDIAAEVSASLKQYGQMRADAQSTIEDAQNEINDAESALRKLMEPRRQLGTLYNPNEQCQIAKDKLAEAQRCFDLDIYSEYLQSQKNAKEAKDIATDINEQIAAFHKIREDAQKAIDAAASVLHRIKQASEQQAAPDKYQTAQERLRAARDFFKLATKSGCSRAYRIATRVETLANEIREQAKGWAELRQFREKAQSAIATAENTLQMLRSKKKAQYVLSELEEVQEKLNQAHSRFERNTRQGYVEATKIATEVGGTSNSSDINKVNRLAEQRKLKYGSKGIEGIKNAFKMGFKIGAGGLIAGLILGVERMDSPEGAVWGGIFGFLGGFLIGLLIK